MYLRGDNFRLMFISRTFPGDWDAKEKWYGTEYKEEKIPQDFLKEIGEALASPTSQRIRDLRMPHENEFIPTQLSVEKQDVPQPAKIPKLIRSDDYIRVWYKKDDMFWVPKATLQIALRKSLDWATLENHVKAQLYCDLVNDALIEYSYNAYLAGLGYSLSAGMFSLGITVSGYNDKISVLLEKVVSAMRDPVIHPERFKVIKERLTRGYQNAEYSQPHTQVDDITSCLITEKTWTNEQYVAELEHIQADDIVAFFPQLLTPNHIEVLAHGNMYKEDALKMTNTVENIVGSGPLSQPRQYVRRNIIFPPGSNYTYKRQLKDPQNVNNCIEYYLFVGQRTDDVLRAQLLLLAQMTDEPAFNQLRTKEQLGYIVWNGAKYLATTVGYHVIIQSERTALYLENRINIFLHSYAQTLQDMTEKEFENHKQSVINQSLQKLKNLGSERSRFWQHIGSGYYNFLEHEIDADSVRKLRKEDFIAFYRQYIDPASESRAKLSVHLNAQVVDTKRLETSAGPDSELVCTKPAQTDAFIGSLIKTVEIHDVSRFKATMSVSPGPPQTELDSFMDFP